MLNTIILLTRTDVLKVLASYINVYMIYIITEIYYNNAIEDRNSKLTAVYKT